MPAPKVTRCQHGMVVKITGMKNQKEECQFCQNPERKFLEEYQMADGQFIEFVDDARYAVDFKPFDEFEAKYTVVAVFPFMVDVIKTVKERIEAGESRQYHLERIRGLVRANELYDTVAHLIMMRVEGR